MSKAVEKKVLEYLHSDSITAPCNFEEVAVHLLEYRRKLHETNYLKKKFAMDLYFFSPRLTWRERFPSAPSLTERDFTGDLFDMMSATQAREKWSIVF